LAEKKIADDRLLKLIDKVRAKTTSQTLLDLCTGAEERVPASERRRHATGTAISPERRGYMREYMARWRKEHPKPKNAPAGSARSGRGRQKGQKRPQKGSKGQKGQPIGGLVMEIKL